MQEEENNGNGNELGEPELKMAALEVQTPKPITILEIFSI
jgi:hypothetical protein